MDLVQYLQDLLGLSNQLTLFHLEDLLGLADLVDLLLVQVGLVDQVVLEHHQYR